MCIYFETKVYQRLVQTLFNLTVCYCSRLDILLKGASPHGGYHIVAQNLVIRTVKLHECATQYAERYGLHVKQQEVRTADKRSHILHGEGCHASAVDREGQL